MKYCLPQYADQFSLSYRSRRCFIFPVLLILLLASACGGKRHVDLEVPDQIPTVKTQEHIHLPGTRVFIRQPKGYQLLPALIRLQRDENTYIQVYEVPRSNYDSEKAKVMQVFQSDSILFSKEFRLGPNTATIVYAPDAQPGRDQAVLLFGDQEYAVMIAGVLKSEDKKACKVIVDAMLSAYVDRAVVPERLVDAPFTLDLSQSRFSYAGNLSKVYYFTIDGKGDPINNPFETNIMVAALPPMNGADAYKDYSGSMIKRYEANGVSIDKREERQITLNGLHAWEVICSGAYQGRKNVVYQLVTGDEASTILYCGTSYTDHDRLLEQFRKTATTLTLKQRSK